MTRTCLLTVTTALLAACADAPEAKLDDTDVGLAACTAPGPLDDVLTLADVQAKGSHNSYHQRPDPLLVAEWGYSQPPIGEQLALHGVRQLELDLHLSNEGVFEVHHVPGDLISSCPRLSDCLGEVKAFLDANPCALPVVIWIEPKDEVDDSAFGYQKLDGHMREVDTAILDVFPRAQVVVPDDVRGGHPDLPTALAADGWPTLDRLRGKVLFSWLDDSPQRDEYVGDTPNLAGRLMFADGDGPTDPWSAMFKINAAVKDEDEVRARIEAGFLVTSNAGGTLGTKDENDDEWAGSLAAGAHFLSTDAPGPALDNGFAATIPGGAPARCNPVVAHPDCTPEALESLPE